MYFSEFFPHFLDKLGYFLLSLHSFDFFVALRVDQFERLFVFGFWIVEGSAYGLVNDGVVEFVEPIVNGFRLF